jgi:LDH2 family malate/lactate/ureidoglycolate dehydrogenase
MMADRRSERTLVDPARLKSFMYRVLVGAGVEKEVAKYVRDGLLQTSLRGVDSHGIRLLPHYMASVESGRINRTPHYKYRKTSASTGILDADHTFGHAAGMEAVKKALSLAGKAGTGHVAVCNSTHFGAAAFYTLEIAKHGMIGMSFTHADSLMKTHAGRRAFLGTNPISFAAPMAGEGPFCLDMATTFYNFNKIKQLREKGSKAPAGVGADENGIETTDPHVISMLLPIGGYKGYGLSLMVEVLCSMLSGMEYGPHITSMYKAPISRKRRLGHFIMAIRIDCFEDTRVFKRRMSEIVNELRREPRLDRSVPVQVAGDPEKRAFAERSASGIPMTDEELKGFSALSLKYGIPFEY